MTFIQAKYFQIGRKAPISLIVLHTMEWAEKPTTAHACAAMFHGKDSPKGSAHYCVDNVNTIQCVKEEDVAWHTRGGDVNERSIGIEMAGFAKQTKEEWEDLYSEKMLERVACLTARLCAQYKIPVAYATPEVLRLGASGITTHRACTKAFNVQGGHTDPGPNFPMTAFLRKVEAYVVYPG